MKRYLNCFISKENTCDGHLNSGADNKYQIIIVWDIPNVRQYKQYE